MADELVPKGDRVEIVSDTAAVGNWKVVEERMEKYDAPTLGQKYYNHYQGLPDFFKSKG